MKQFLTFFILFLFFAGCQEAFKKQTVQGTWAFSLPDKRPVWLDISEDTTASLLWSVGSAKPVEILHYTGDTIVFSGNFGWRPFGKQWQSIDYPFLAYSTAEDSLILKVKYTANNKVDSVLLNGSRIPPVPPAPDLSEVTLGKEVNLLEYGMQEWRVADTSKINGWHIENGVLINETPKTSFSAWGEYANLITRDTFYDFSLEIDYNVPEGGNSGIYLRGAYEVQVVDSASSMQGIQGPGAVFGRIEPSHNAGKPGGEWNKLNILLINRHVTVSLNGDTVIFNEPLPGCTGGGINSHDNNPGPLFLQGDHTSVKYRNIFIRRVIKPVEN